MANAAGEQAHFEVLLIGEVEVLRTWREVAQGAGLLKTVSSRIFGTAYGIERDGLALHIEVVDGATGWQPQSGELALFLSRKDRLSPAQISKAKELVLDFVAAFPVGAIRPIVSVEDDNGSFSWLPLVRSSSA